MGSLAGPSPKFSPGVELFLNFPEITPTGGPGPGRELREEILSSAKFYAICKGL